MTKLGIAIIGTGNTSLEHIRAMKDIDKAELKAIMSHDPARAESFAIGHNVKAYSNIDELLKDAEINIVDIASYHNVHVDYALKSVKAGKHVIIEKPIGISLEMLDELYEEAARNNVKVTVISQSRFDKAFIDVKRKIDAGELGRVISVNADLLNNKPANDYENHAWKTSKEKAGGGIMMMKAIHLIDVLLWMFGKVKTVYGKVDVLKHKINVEDSGFALLKMKNNTIISIHASGAANYSHPFRITIFGEKKTLTVEAGKVIEIQNDKQKSNMLSKLENKLPVSIKRVAKYDIGTIQEQIKQFINSITENKENNLLASISDGKEALEVILAMYKSSKTGREIKISNQ